jgi:pimeloyl-ACP methyl ester carboxylesterase
MNSRTTGPGGPGGYGGPGGRLTANGLQIAYDAHGAGPPLVLLHGASSAGREDFAAQVPLFSKAFRVYLPDARGHAGTRLAQPPTRDEAAAGPSSRLSQDLLVADLLAFADAMGLSTFHVVGFSMGAMTALRFAVRHTGRLRTLVVIGTAVEREPRLSVARRILDPDRIERDDPSWAEELRRRHDTAQGQGGWQQTLRDVIHEVATQPEITPEELRRVELPAMVVCGDRDPFVSVGQAWGLQRQLPDARLLVVPGCGHDVMVRRPALFNEAMGSFYRTTAAVARDRAAAGIRRVPTAGGDALAGPEGAPDPVLVEGSLAHPDGAPPHGTNGEWLAGASGGAGSDSRTEGTR